MHPHGSALYICFLSSAVVLSSSVFPSLYYKDFRLQNNLYAFLCLISLSSFVLSPSSLKERFEDIVPVGEDKQRKEQPETNVVRHLKELIARLLARDDLP